MAKTLPLFDPGHVVRTFSALDAMLTNHVSQCSLLERHCSGDFGDVGSAQRLRNLRAIAGQGRVVSAYPIAPRNTVWVMTRRESGRWSTTVMTPPEYHRRARGDKPPAAPQPATSACIPPRS